MASCWGKAKKRIGCACYSVGRGVVGVDVPDGGKSRRNRSPLGWSTSMKAFISNFT